MPFGDKASEDFVLGQRSGFGKEMDKEYKNSSVKRRQRDLVRFLTAQGEEQNKNNKIMDDRFEKSINSPAYTSAQNLNNFAGSGRKVKYNQAGRGRVMADPNPNNPFRDIYEFARDNPKAFETMMQGTVAQSPTKALGYVGEQFTGDPTTGNRFSEGVLNELTKKRDGIPRFRPEMTDEEKRVAGNAFYAQQLKDNEGQDMAKGVLQEGGFTTDATYGDALDTASWLIPGPGMAVKGLGVGVKASRLALAAAKSAEFSSKTKKIAATGAALGAAGVYAGKPEDAEAASLDAIFNLNRVAKAGGRMRTELSRITRSIDKTTRSRFGSGKGIGQSAVSEMANSYIYNPLNRNYIDSVRSGDTVLSDESKFVEAAHDIGNTPELGGPRNPSSFTSGELNRLELDMRKAGELPKNSIDIMSWAIKNNDKYKGLSIMDMIKRMGT